MATSEKRARTAATIENRTKTMTERLEVKAWGPLIHHLQIHPPFIQRYRRGRTLIPLVSTRPRARETGEVFRTPCGSEFLPHVVIAGQPGWN